MSDGSATAFADGQVDCVDWDATAEAMKANDEVQASDDAVDDYVDCMRDIPEDEQKDAIKHQAMGDSGDSSIITYNVAKLACLAHLAG
jgi:hypothetical protein